jgi:tetratricopeptide (TPR) repeat protein
VYYELYIKIKLIKDKNLIILMEQFKLKGNEYFKNGDYDKALENYNEALKLSPDNYILFSNISAVYLKLKDSKKALEYSIQCTKLSPKWAKGWSRLGSALMLDEKNDKALIAFKKSRELDNNNSFVNDIITKLEEDTEEESDEEPKIDILPNENKNNPNMFNPNMFNPNMFNSNNMNPNNMNPNNLDPNMMNLFSKMMSNSKISNKMMDPNFQKKVMESKNNPMEAMKDPAIMDMMKMMMSEMK